MDIAKNLVIHDPALGPCRSTFCAFKCAIESVFECPSLHLYSLTISLTLLTHSRHSHHRFISCLLATLLVSSVSHKETVSGLTRPFGMVDRVQHQQGVWVHGTPIMTLPSRVLKICLRPLISESTAH